MPVAGRTVVTAWLTLSEWAEIAAQETVAIVFCNRDGYSAVEADRGDL